MCMQVVVATGKAKGPWTKKVLPQLPPMPGVYVQGLLLYGADGKVIYEHSLSKELLYEIIKLAKEFGETLPNVMPCT